MTLESVPGVTLYRTLSVGHRFP
ncbi:hypothetical protein SBA6_310012 [Candidatus Sulfopaludibacter sp. SbA6]|nr:hypothetical protein SBA6_310012 [Candidatus Sulfopaludibacter sp. SbA6]